jgi:hypothetical protein
MLTPDDFRDLVLAMEGASEGAHMGHPDFRAANGRIFASLHTNDTFGMVILTPEEQRAVMKANPGTFVPSSGAWGRNGCTNVVLEKASKPQVRGAILLAWQTISAKPAARPRKTGTRATSVRAASGRKNSARRRR